MALNCTTIKIVIGTRSSIIDCIEVNVVFKKKKNPLNEFAASLMTASLMTLSSITASSIIKH